MADSNTIDSTLKALQQYGVDTGWLSGWLPTLSDVDQKAALDALNKQTVRDSDEANTVAHQAVDQSRQAQVVKKDPATLLALVGRGQDMSQLKDYFQSDPYLKTHKDAQMKIAQEISKQAVLPKGVDDVVATAKQINWQSLAPKERFKYYGYQEGDLKNLDEIKQQRDDVNWSQVEGYINSRKSPADKYAALQYVNQQVQSGGFLGQQAIDNLAKALPSIVNPTSTATTTTDTSGATPASTAAQPQGAAAAAQLAPQTGATTVTDMQKQLYKEATGGQDFDTAYKSFIQNYGIAIQNQNAVTGAEDQQGGTQLWTTGGFTPPPAGSTYGPAQHIAAGDTQHQVSEAQFLGFQAAGALKLSSAALQTANTMWASNHATTMPAGAAQAVVQKIAGMSPSNQAALAADPQGLQSPSLGLGNILADYAAKNPSQAPASGSDDQTYQMNLERGASPIPGYADLGQYTAVAKKMDQLWQANFHREPTTTEQQYFGGWNPDEIEGWVLSQQSPDNPNMTIGERQGYINAGNKSSQQIFGTNIDSRMVDLMDGHFNPHQQPPPKPDFSLPPPPATNPPSAYANGAATR